MKLQRTASLLTVACLVYALPPETGATAKAGCGGI